MTAPPRLKIKDFRTHEEFYRARDTEWHLRELAEIMKASREGRSINVRGALGRAVER